MGNRDGALVNCFGWYRTKAWAGGKVPCSKNFARRPGEWGVEELGGGRGRERPWRNPEKEDAGKEDGGAKKKATV